MLTNYLKIAWRSLWRNKLFSVVNIVGLALSMAVGLELLSELKATFDTDHFHPHLNRTVRVLTNTKTPDRTLRWATVPQPMADQLRHLSTVEAVVEVRQGQFMRVLSPLGEVMLGVSFTEPSFFKVFGFSLETGDATALMRDLNAVFISRKVVGKLFGTRNPIGQSIQFDGLGRFTVAGIIRKPDLPSHLHFDAVFPIQTALNAERKG